MKYSACAECEIMCYRTLWNIAPSSQCEMKFAHSHLRSKYFTAKLFHMAKPYFTRRRRISLKKAHIVLVDKCVLFSGGEGEIWTLAPVLPAYTLSRGASSASWVLLHGRVCRFSRLAGNIIPHFMPFVNMFFYLFLCFSKKLTDFLHRFS